MTEVLNKMRLLTPGPTPLPEEVRLSLAKDMVHHRKPFFKDIMAEISLGLRELFGTDSQVLSLTASGTGSMYAAVTNIFQPGEKVLVVEAGKFAERWTEIAKAHDLETQVLQVPWGSAVNPEDVRTALDNDRNIKGVLIQASETSTGVLHPIKQIGEITSTRDTILVVDGISAIGVSPCPMDAWRIDCLLTGSQKGLMLPPGLAFIALNARTWERVEQNPPRNFYFNLLGERRNNQQKQTLFTPGINLLVALKTSLELFRQTGLENIYRKQYALSMLTRAGIEAMGLEPFAARNFTWGLTSVALPPGIDGQKLVARAAERHGVVMAGGQDKLKGRIVRIGHMGYVDFADILAGLYAFREAYVSLGGYTASRDYLEKAATAYEEGLNTDISQFM